MHCQRWNRCLLWFFAVSLASHVAAAEPMLSRSAIAQIQALGAEKDARSVAERKIDSRLLYTARMARGRAVAPGVPTLETGIDVDARGMVAVDIRARVTPRLEALVKAIGGDVIRSFAFAESIEADVPIDRLEHLAADAGVRFIMPPAQGVTTRNMPGMSAGSGMPIGRTLSPRVERFRSTLIDALQAQARASAPLPDVGAVTSQGDAAHRADAARDGFGVNGAGIRIGVISDSFAAASSPASEIAAGDLPGPGNPNGFTTPVQLVGSGDAFGGSDEGRAMLQIVHDLAPGAQLYSATGFNSITDFANNIRALRGIAMSAPPNGNLLPGCDIIIDDLFYFIETGLHDGQPAPSDSNMAVVTQAVNDVTADGALYFSSAGNSGGLTQGTSGAWEGDFVSGALPVVIPGSGDALAWNGSDIGNTITVAGSVVTLQWSDPLNGSANDYDLFVLDSTLSSVVASSTNVQDGSQDPLELIGSGPGNRIVIVRRDGAAPRFLSLSTNRGRLQHATSGQTRGHSAAATGFSVAATPAEVSFGAPTPPGPFPGPFVAGNQVEPFSSDGLRRSFFDASGNAITPGNFLAAGNGGSVGQKPDITAADGTSTSVPGFARFFGTSAAAPHAGAIAALVKQAAPTATPQQVRDILESTALDIMAPGADRDAGIGILQAFEAVQSTGVAPQASLALGAIAVISGNNLINADDCNTLSITLRNDGAISASAISATLSATTPGITITQPFASFTDIDSSGDSASALFEVSSSPSAISGSTITFNLTVTSTGGESPRVLTFTLPLGVDPLAYAFAGASPGAGIPAGGTLLVGSAADDVVVTTSVPFAFSIYDREIASGETISISTNGNVQFVAAGATTTFQNAGLPAGALPDAPALFPYWDDLLLTTPGGGIYTHVTGAPPNRRFVIEWRGQRYRDGATTQTVNFAVAIEEGSSRFAFLYAQTGIGASANGASATVGVHAGNAASSRASTVSINQPVIVANTTYHAAPLVPLPGVGQCSDVVFVDGFE